MQSIYGPYIEQYIAFKRQVGYKYITEEAMFARLDRWIQVRGETTPGITKKLAADWMQKRPNESDSFRYKRALCLNQLSSFLNQLGIRSHINPLPHYNTSFIPYIYSRNEITSIFEACDGLTSKKKDLIL